MDQSLIINFGMNKEALGARSYSRCAWIVDCMSSFQEQTGDSRNNVGHAPCTNITRDVEMKNSYINFNQQLLKQVFRASFRTAAHFFLRYNFLFQFN